MADYKDIAGRIRTTAADGIVVESQEIIDLQNNKTQQEINSDVQTELGERYTKEETYSKEQLDDLITTPDVNYVSVVATNATTAVTDILPATGEANTIYRVGNWNGTQYDTTMYALFAWNGTTYVCLAVRSFVGEVYDVSVNHPDGQGNPTLYADLTEALGTDGANIPADIRRGGMSIKFIQGTVQGSDNNYVQYRCIANEFTTDTTQWVIANEGVYVENPEFIYVKTDSEGKILWAIKIDGGIYYGAGVPQQVIDYIEEKIAELSLDEYEDIVAFLDNLEKGDKTLQDLLDEKVDKVEGKSLIPTQYIQEVENPEFINAELDAEQKLLGGIKEDGTYWFNKIKSPTLDNLQKEVNDAIEESQEALIEHYDYYNVSKHHTIRDVFNIYTANTGWQQVEYDSTAAMYDELDIYQIGEVCNYDEDTEHSYEALISQRGVAPAIITKEYVTRRKFTLDEALSLLPAEILTAFAAGQMICFVDLDDIVEEWQLSESGSWVRVNPYEIKDPEGRVEIKLDNDNKIIAYRKADGTWVECVGIEAPNLGDFVDKEEGKSLIDEGFAESCSSLEDPEGRLEIVTDSEDKIISYRKSDGTLVENVGIETNHLELTKQGMTDFQQALKDAGFRPGGGGDFTDKPSMQIPIPHLAFVNITAPNGNAIWPTSKKGRPDYNPGVNCELQYYMEFYDSAGNYFKKEIIFSAQGQSSMGFPKKNGAVDFCNNNGWDDDDTFSMKFGDWVAQDSFHLKAYYTNFFKGEPVVGYDIAEIIFKSRGVDKDTSWKKALLPSGINDGSDTSTVIDDMSLQIDTGARCMPDGFPCIVFLNGNFYGIYSWQLKKHRDNYHMSKSNAKHIHLDGTLYRRTFWNGTIDWTAFEVRNPKNLCYKTLHNGTYKYDADVAQDEIAGIEDNTVYLGDWVAGSYDVGKIVKHGGDYFINMVANNTEEPVTSSGGNKNTAKDPDYKNKTGCGWVNCTTTVKVKQSIISLSTHRASVNALATDEEKLAFVLAHYDKDNIIDYIVHSQITANYDGWGKNWQIITYDGSKWFIEPYDLDGIFGYNFKGTFTQPADWTYNEHSAIMESFIRNGDGSHFSRIIYDTYRTEIAERYQYIRSTLGVSADSIIERINKWAKTIGEEYYTKEYEKWPKTPCNRDNKLNDGWTIVPDEYWGNDSYNPSTVYNEGDTCWLNSRKFMATESVTGVSPYIQLGHRDNLYRIYKWLINRFEILDNYYNNYHNN